MLPQRLRVAPRRGIFAPMSEQDNGTYPGGFPAILRQMDGRRKPLAFGRNEALPPLDTDLTVLLDRVVLDPASDPDEQTPLNSSHQRKRREIRAELAGASELCALNGLLIAHLRKRAQPGHTAALFHRLWAEHADHLLAGLDLRWLVSSITTFGDHGLTDTQRQTGQAMTVLFGTMKLYETERLYSGFAPGRPFKLAARTSEALPMQMDAYSMAYGGLDVNMLGRIWQDADRDAVIRPLAHHLLDQLIADERTVFRRLAMMRHRLDRRRRQKAEAKSAPPPAPAQSRGLSADTPRWGLVSTVKGPLRQIARFAAHHIELGADRIDLYLDAPDPATIAALSHPRLNITACDDAWWQATGKERPPQHQLRQAHNATLSYRASDLDWLGHIDMDEFLLTNAPVATTLGDAHKTFGQVRMLPAEVLSSPDGVIRHFKLTREAAGQPVAAAEEIYPTFGMHLRDGFISHTTGKVFARTGIDDARLGVHSLKIKGARLASTGLLPGIFAGHLHAPDWAHFRAHLEFRRAKGSYRERPDSNRLGMAPLLDFLRDESGEDGVRRMFDELCLDTADLRARLASHNMLLTHNLDLDAAVDRVFGELPDG